MTIPIVISYSVIIVYFIFWVIGSVIAIRNKQEIPWSGLILVFAFFFSRYSFRIHGIIDISISLLFLLALYGLFIERKNLKSFFFNQGKLSENIGLGFFYGAITGAFFAIFVGVNSIPEIDGSLPLLSFTFAIAQASAGEEILVRGIFLGYLIRFGLQFWPAMIIQTTVFTLAHVSLYYNNLMALILIIWLGFIAGYLTLRKNSIVPAITMHITINLIAVAIYIVQH